MHSDHVIKLSSRILYGAILLLVYWVFCFLLINAFDLKVFRESLSSMFGMSLLGIFAVLGGALILNISANLNKISAAQAAAAGLAPPPDMAPRKRNLRALALLLLFPLLAALLFGAHHVSTKRKNALVEQAGLHLLNSNQSAIQALRDYRFERAWLEQARENLLVLNNIDTRVPVVHLVAQDQIQKQNVLLSFSPHELQRALHPEKDEAGKRTDNEPTPLNKGDFLLKTTHQERQYLEQVFAGKQRNPRLFREGATMRLYHPLQQMGGNVALLLTEEQHYGKM
ncbi:hypothetical protein V8J88_19595 [Massilia sp. W12]|uniref:hypothetical protein n=1 Tax=Massilia sp. W12 TaxID=3126507 RepID=UPI0030CE236C